MHRLYLSRRNLQTLLDKLDAGRAQAAIMKNDLTNRNYPTSVATMVVAIEDDLYYAHCRPDPPDMVVVEAPPRFANKEITVGEYADYTPNSGPITIKRRGKKN